MEGKAGKAAREAFEEFKRVMLDGQGLSESSAYIPPLALRGDIGALASLTPYFIKLMGISLKGRLLTGPFSDVMDRFQVTNMVQL